MKIKNLKKILDKINDDLPIFVSRFGGFGTVGEIDQVEKTTYGCFGAILPCIILNSDSVIKDVNGVYYPYIETSGLRDDGNQVVAFKDNNYFGIEEEK